MKIVIDDKIPFINGILEKYGDVTYLPAESITKDVVKDSTALFIRTRTHIDNEFLRDSSLKFIATATIGIDHIDKKSCDNAGVFATNAPGCNAPAVAQYVFSSIAYWKKRRKDKRTPSTVTIGIVGVGHIGKIVEKWARQLGFKVLLNDPYRAENENPTDFVSIDDIASKADIITFHTPLTKSGRYPSWHLCGADFLAKCVRSPLVINAARGAVVDTQALISAIDNGLVRDAVIDCWENEPEISTALLRKAVVATPHIAGYSLQGKIRATQICLNYFSEYFGINPTVKLSQNVSFSIPDVHELEQFYRSYNPMNDMAKLLAEPQSFERLRDFYPLRNEIE